MSLLGNGTLKNSKLSNFLKKVLSGESMSAGLSSASNNSSGSACEFDFGESFKINRFVVVAVMMSSVCVVGFFGNLLIVVILSQKRMRSPSNYYLVVLALFDTSVMAVSILLYVIETIYDYTKNYDLYLAWSAYVEVLYGFSHFFQVVTVYLTLAATIERAISLSSFRPAKKLCTNLMPFLWIAIVLVFSILCTGSRFFELVIIENHNCTGQFGEYLLRPAPLLIDPTYNAWYTVWLSNILFIFLPFMVLAALNTLIYQKMRMQFRIENLQVRFAMNGNDAGSKAVRKTRKESRKNREETIVLFVVVAVFLVCNFPGFALTVIEQIAGNFLAVYEEFYATTRDVINLLAVINSAANFTIYLILGSEFRREIRILAVDMCRIIHCRQLAVKFGKSQSFDDSSADIEKDIDVSEISDPWYPLRQCADSVNNMENGNPACAGNSGILAKAPSYEIIWQRQSCIYWRDSRSSYPVSHI